MAGTKKPYGITNIVSWGASVVIIGLLFKIQHWPYGGTLLYQQGLITLKPHCSFFWASRGKKKKIISTGRRVYPEVDARTLKANCQNHLN